MFETDVYVTLVVIMLKKCRLCTYVLRIHDKRSRFWSQNATNFARTSEIDGREGELEPTQYFMRNKEETDSLSKSCPFNQIKLWYLIVPPRFRGLPTALNCIWRSILDGRVHLLKLCWTTSKCIISLFFLAQKLQIMRLFLFPHVFKIHITQLTRNRHFWKLRKCVFNMSLSLNPCEIQGNQW